MASKIYVEDIWAEDLIRWWFDSIDRDGGDGGGVICRENYKEMAKWIIDHLDRKPSYIIEDERSITFGWDQDNFCLTNDPNFILPYHEYNFLVKKDCPPGWSKEMPTFKAINNVTI